LPNTQPKVDESYWKAALDSTWQGLIRRNINPYSEGKGLIHRPKSETPGDAVSEAVGYGMLVALFANDQDHFNSIWDAANDKMWGGCYYNWQMAPSGMISGEGAATDAEEDVALALIFADKLVSAGKWQPYTSTKFNYGYADHAKKILDCMWETQQITSSGILAPGAGWGGDSFVNPGYFSPAWYRIFAKFDSNGDRWNKVVEKTYEILSKSPGYSMGMIPDWMRPMVAGQEASATTPISTAAPSSRTPSASCGDSQLTPCGSTSPGQRPSSRTRSHSSTERAAPKPRTSTRSKIPANSCLPKISGQTLTTARTRRPGATAANTAT
jgi:endo-1,4-beta-D-glucanase Y